jgi:hypothetical protein
MWHDMISDFLEPAKRGTSRGDLARSNCGSPAPSTTGGGHGEKSFPRQRPERGGGRTLVPANFRFCRANFLLKSCNCRRFAFVHSKITRPAWAISPSSPGSEPCLILCAWFCAFPIARNDAGQIIADHDATVRHERADAACLAAEAMARTAPYIAAVAFNRVIDLVAGECSRPEILMSFGDACRARAVGRLTAWIERRPDVRRQTIRKAPGEQHRRGFFC